MKKHPLSPSSFSSLFADYLPQSDCFDEAVSDGELRPHYRKLVQHLDKIGVEALRQRWQRGPQEIVSHSLAASNYEASGSPRPWQLGPLPVLIDEPMWKTIGAGLEQRAKLCEHVLDDLLSHQGLLKERLLPPEVLYANPSFCPPYHDLHDADHRSIQLFASDLAHGPDGQWWVTGDRARAPFGLGYLLENRIVTSRNLPVPFRQCRVQRLAPFFMTLRESLRDMATRSRDNPRIVLWTKGPQSPSYVEDAYLARYLGYTLVEGDDLAVRGNRVMLKTLGGLLPVEVIFRRLDDDDCDPVELDPHSTSGVSGLVEVLRCGQVAISNSLGSRLVESPILLPYLREICRRRLGEDLILPTAETWWCGEPRSRQHVFAHFDEWVIRPAFRSADAPVTFPALLDREKRVECIAEIEARPWAFVAQRPVMRSTTPVWTDDGSLRAWPVALRGFVVQRDGGYTALPSGLGRVAPDRHTLEQVMTAGERSLDVWVLSEKPVEDISLLTPSKEALPLRRSGDDLPSRVADNLFWLGRNIERAESQARLLRTTLMRLTGEQDRVPEIPVLVRALAERGQIEPDYAVDGLSQTMPPISEMLPRSAVDARLALSLRASIREAVRIASHVRDRVALDLWHIMTRVDETSRMAGNTTPEPSEVIAMLDPLITELVALSGLAAESMTRTQAWRFLELGKRIERAWQTAILCRATLAQSHRQAENGVLEAVLATVDSGMTYHSRYLASIQAAPVIDLVICDETNPRSIGFQLASIVSHVDRLPRSNSEGPRSLEQRIALSILNSTRLADPRRLAKTDDWLARPALIRLVNRIIARLPRLAEAISGRFLIHVGLQRHYSIGQGED